MATIPEVPKYSDAVLRKGFVKGPGGISLEQAKADMLAAQEPVTSTRGGTKVPKFVQRDATRGQGGNSPKVAYTPAEIADANESLQSGAQSSVAATPAPVTPARVAATPSPVAQPAANPTVQEAAPQPAISQRLADEESEFFYETYQDNRDGKWYAIVNFKPDANGNQPGAEKFVADNQSELILKILKGKGHSTSKIRSLSQAHKLGGRPDLSEYFAAELQKTHALTVAEFNALPDKSRAALTDTMYAAEAMYFKDQHPEYNLGEPEGAKNLQAVVGYIRKQGWPVTRRNLEIGWNDLEAAKKITVAEPAPALVQTATPVTPAAPRRIRGQSTTGLVPGGSSAEWGGGIDDDGPRAQQARNSNPDSNVLTPERIKELSKTREGMEQVKRSMRAGFKPQAPTYR
jgi:hypothetical protein